MGRLGHGIADNIALSCRWRFAPCCPCLGEMIWMIAAAPGRSRRSVEGRAGHQYVVRAVVEPESGLREEAQDGAIAVPDEHPADVDVPDVLPCRRYLRRGKRNVMRGVVVLSMDQVRVERVLADGGEGGGRYSGGVGDRARMPVGSGEHQRLRGEPAAVNRDAAPQAVWDVHEYGARAVSGDGSVHLDQRGRHGTDPRAA